jgi:DNA-directed RNA polymerase specialized sigma24 family protein
VLAELVAQRPLLERAAAGDRGAFARLYDGQVGGVYRYLLAWTGDRPRAAELTGQVFRSAPRWLAATARDRAEAGAWLIAMARDAVQGPTATPDPPTTPPANPAEAVARLPDPQREVVALRLLCGHSLDHTAHLSGYPRRAVLELQLAACRSIATLTGQARPADPSIPAEEFERHLERWKADPGAGDLFRAGPPPADPALGVAGSLRQAAPGLVTAPDPAFVRRLGQDLPAPEARPDPSVAGAPGTHPGAPGTHPVPGRVPRWGSVADAQGSRRRLSTGSGTGRRGWRDRLSAGWREVSPSRRPWVSTAVATAGIVVALALRAFGDPGPVGACGGRPCPAPTTAVAAASSVGTPLTTVLQPSTTGPAATGQAPSTSPRSAPATSPPTTRPPTTAPPTTAPPRPTTTTRATTTTATPTTLPPTTTTAPGPT